MIIHRALQHFRIVDATAKMVPPPKPPADLLPPKPAATQPQQTPAIITSNIPGIASAPASQRHHHTRTNHEKVELSTHFSQAALHRRNRRHADALITHPSHALRRTSEAHVSCTRGPCPFPASAKMRRARVLNLGTRRKLNPTSPGILLHHSFSRRLHAGSLRGPITSAGQSAATDRILTSTTGGSAAIHRMASRW